MEKKLNCIDGLTLKNEISDVSNTHLMNANFNNINDVIRITELYGDSESSFSEKTRTEKELWYLCLEIGLL